MSDADEATYLKVGKLPFMVVMLLLTDSRRSIIFNRSALIWPLAALSLAFCYYEIFLWRALQYYHWLVLIA